MVRKGGLEPPQPYGHWTLNPARLPIPPLPQIPGAEKLIYLISPCQRGCRHGNQGVSLGGSSDFFPLTSPRIRMSSANEKPQIRLVAQNRKARYEYHILEIVEAGLVLTGTEVKSLRNGKATLGDAYGVIDGEQAWLYHLHIGAYEQGNRFNHEPMRKRKLLLHKKELRRLIGKIQEKGLTLIPLKLYFRGGWAKVELGLAKGKKAHDKRHDIAKRDAERDMERALAHRNRS
jgi:SsrA-binding protein